MSADRQSQASANGQHTPEQAPKATEDASAPQATDDLERGEVAEPDVLKLLVKQLRELGEYVLYYAAAKIDIAKLSLRNTILWISFAALGFVVVAGLIITATCLLLNGIAGGMSVLFGGRLWVGNIVTGVLLLVGLGLTMYCTVAICRITSRERMVRKYEQRQARQQARFGRNVLDPTADTASRKK
jgi:hypothetical protein